MNLNASIIDQRLAGVQDEIEDRASAELGINEAGRLKSLAFVYLCVKTMLDLESDETFDCLTDGGGDFGVDALHITEEMDGEFGVTLFQGKYKRNLEGNANFEQNGIEAMVNAIRHIFDPSADLGAINDRLRVKVEQARSLIRDGFIPRVRAIACNNGLKWNAEAQHSIDCTGFGDQVTWEHVNHDVLVSILRRMKPVNETLRLSGKAIVEDMNFSRVCIGRIPVPEVAALMQNHGERLLERNIRRYLGLHGNRVNEGIRATLTSAEPANFYFFNNGLTLVCEDFSYNALQNSDYQIKVENLQIVNGGQTCMTIFKTAEEFQKKGRVLPPEAAVLVRIYKLPKDNEDIVLRITQATNSQNPVDLKDLRANDAKQQQLEQSVQDLGYTYRRKRMDGAPRPADITTGAAAEAVLAVWRQAPHQAKFLTREHFGKLYGTIFTESLNGAQVVIAALLYRIAENHRRRPHENDPLFVRYASCFIAMQMGRRLLKELGAALDGLDHRNFAQAKQLIDEHGEAYFTASRQDIDVALKALYGDEGVISVQQLSATFRRGDLIEKLKQVEV
jgi:hypothetical protein